MVQTDNNAMTEVALALAMAFFAIFILAAVSMSQPMAQEKKHEQKAGAPEKIVHDLNLQFENDAERALAGSEILLIFHKGTFLDTQLKPVSLESMADRNAQYVVAVSPDLSMAEMLKLKQQKKLPNLAITLLNNEWQQRLEQIK